MKIRPYFQAIINIVYLLTLVAIFVSCEKIKNPVVKNWPRDNPADSLSFLVIGDWGNNGSDSQKLVARQMIRYARSFNAKFVISTGDNFYPAGVSSIYDTKWSTSFEEVYPYDSIPLKWYVALGNHDYMSDPDAEIQYSTISNRWVMPSRYYDIIKDIGSRSKIHFVFTDTSPFDSESYVSYSNESAIKSQDTALQVRWLSNMLSIDTKWKIVIGHHPAYSVGHHGENETLINRFIPVFEQNKVDYYLSGHDHNLQYIKKSNSSINYVVSGAGSKATPIYSGTKTFATATPGFIMMTVYATKAVTYFINYQGKVLYQFTVTKG
ncbi:MAG TPA: metallophosphoesterase [Flavitalea sp.]|nr:metallophosphoesterase [Flavitalea sp.]